MNSSPTTTIATTNSQTSPDPEAADHPGHSGAAPTLTEPLSRRGFLRSAALAGGGLVAVGVAACAPSAGAPTWTFGPPAAAGANAGQPSPGTPGASAPAASPSHDHASNAPTASGAPPDHDAAALAVVKRFLDGEYGKVEGAGNQPIEPRVEGGVKVFDFTVDKISHL
ncbi:MAG TPA: hypothetical protein VFY18_07725, partial [Candidatus Limnocylindrales bacterium]|nr:hypothetical protein [Candidatus Limnocylindrales bacterium]